MIIKVDKGDRIDNIEYLEIDETLLKDDLELDYENNSIYILHYPCGDEIKVSYGRGFIKNEKYDFENIHKCKTYPGSSGSPIFNLSTNKIIGIHKAYEESVCDILGIFLKYPLLKVKELFQKKDKKTKKSSE